VIWPRQVFLIPEDRLPSSEMDCLARHKNSKHSAYSYCGPIPRILEDSVAIQQPQFRPGHHSSNPMTRSRIDDTLHTSGIPAIGRTALPSTLVATLFRLVPTIFLPGNRYRGD